MPPSCNIQEDSTLQPCLGHIALNCLGMGPAMECTTIGTSHSISWTSPIRNWCPLMILFTWEMLVTAQQGPERCASRCYTQVTLLVLQ
jgi:hypothetical protein